MPLVKHLHWWRRDGEIVASWGLLQTLEEYEVRVIPKLVESGKERYVVWNLATEKPGDWIAYQFPSHEPTDYFSATNAMHDAERWVWDVRLNDRYSRSVLRYWFERLTGLNAIQRDWLEASLQRHYKSGVAPEFGRIFQEEVRERLLAVDRPGSLPPPPAQPGQRQP